VRGRAEPSTGLVVELCGLPGAGKSSLAALTVEAFRQRGVVVPDPAGGVGPQMSSMLRATGKSALVAGAVLRQPGSALRSAMAVGESQQPSSSDALHRWVQWTVAQERVRRARRMRQTALLDEGVVQALWSMGLFGDVEPMLRTITRRRGGYAQPDLTVVLEVPSDVAAERLTTRGSAHSRVQSVPPGHLESTLRRGKELLDSILSSVAGGFSDGAIARVDGSGAPPVSELVGLIDARRFAGSARP
jgi:hypothetical protein